MSPDHFQPADETPLILPPIGDAAPPPTVPTDAGTRPAPAPTAQEQATAQALVAGWEGLVLPAYGEVTDAINTALSDAIDSINRQTGSVRRVLTKAIKSADDAVQTTITDLQAAGVYPAMGTNERLAELSHDGPELMVERLTAAVPPTTFAPGDDNFTCWWEWNGRSYVWMSPNGIPAPGPPPEGNAFLAVGDKIPFPCPRPGPAPVPTPPADPAPVPPTTTPSPTGGPCGAPWSWADDGGSSGVRFWAPPNAALDNHSAWYLFADPVVGSGTAAVWLPHSIDVLPPWPFQLDFRSGDSPDPSWHVYGVGPEIPCGPTSPPASPPPPPPPAACPPPTIVVNCAPACGPTPPTVPTTPDYPVPPKPAPVPPTPVPPVPPTTTPDGPAKPKPIAATPGPPGLSNINWDIPTVCSTADAVADGQQADDLPTKAGEPSGWAWWVAAGKEATQWVIPGVLPSVVGLLSGKGVEPGRLNELGVNTIIGSSLSETAKAFMPGAAVPNADAGWAMAAKLGIVNRAEQLIGAPISYMFQSTQYLYQYLNPQMLPGQAEVDQLYLSNRITSSYWECLTRANGNLPTIHSLILDSKATRPIASEIIQLRLRDIIPNDAEYVSRMRELGVVDAGHAVEFLKLAKWIPGPGNLIRYMVRDAADPKAVESGELDKGFGDKFTGPILDWARAQGVDPEVFKYEWYSHWEYPSNTSIFSQVQRLREDREEVRQWDRQFALSVVAGQPLDRRTRPPVFTMEDARRVLAINDMAPGHIEGVLATCFHPITNSDARRAYMIGFRDEGWLIERMKDNGYVQADAELLSEFFKAERERTISSQTGILSPRKVLAAYKEGLIDVFETDRQLVDTFPDPGVRRNQIRKADLEQRIEIQRAQKAGLRKGYVFGEYDDPQCEGLLRAYGFTDAQIEPIIRQFQAARMSQKKEPRVKMLCEWYTHKLLTEAQYFDRVLRLGYTADDAHRMASVCAADAAAKRARELQQATERARKEAKGNLSDLKAQIKDAEAHLKEVQAATAKAGGK